MEVIEILGGLKVEPGVIKLEKQDNENVVELGDEDVKSEEILGKNPEEKNVQIKDIKNEFCEITTSNFNKESEINHSVDSTRRKMKTHQQSSKLNDVLKTSDDQSFIEVKINVLKSKCENVNAKQSQPGSVERVPASKTTNTKTNGRTLPNKISISSTTNTKPDEEAIPNKNLIWSTTDIKTDEETMQNNSNKISISSNTKTSKQNEADKRKMLNETSVLSRLDGEAEYSHEGEENYKCNYCGDVIEGERDTKLHILRVHKNVKLYQCPKCPYQSPFRLWSHMLHMHTDDKDIQFVSCYICGYKTKTKHGLRKHIQSHADKTEMIGQSHRCTQCPKVFKQRYSLRRHVSKVHDKAHLALLKCKFCPFRSKVKIYLERHEAMHYTESGAVKTWKCSQCTFDSPYKPRLTAHVKLRHGSRNYQCHICAYRAKTEALLNLHLIGHKEKKDEQDLKFRCDRCDYKTYRDYNLHIHKLNHLKPEEIVYFYCHHCDFKAKRKDNLKSHIFRHFKKEELTLACYVCDFTTKKRDKLVRHIEEHSKELKEPKKKDNKVNSENFDTEKPESQIEKNSKELKQEPKKKDTIIKSESDEMKDE